MRKVLAGTFRSLTIRNFRLFVSGQVVSVMGTWMMIVAQDWLVLDLSDDSSLALATVTALQFTPMLFLTLLGGRLADRFDKRTLLTVCNAVSGDWRWGWPSSFSAGRSNWGTSTFSRCASVWSTPSRRPPGSPS